MSRGGLALFEWFSGFMSANGLWICGYNIRKYTKRRALEREMEAGK